MSYRVYLEFYPDIHQPVDQVVLMFGAQSHAEAIQIALNWKDSMLPDAKLKNINCYER